MLDRFTVKLSAIHIFIYRTKRRVNEELEKYEHDKRIFYEIFWKHQASTSKDMVENKYSDIPANSFASFLFC